MASGGAGDGPCGWLVDWLEKEKEKKEWEGKYVCVCVCERGNKGNKHKQTKPHKEDTTH